jgi:GDA1/CD39 (nucleoside phosphatase) family
VKDTGRQLLRLDGQASSQIATSKVDRQFNCIACKASLCQTKSNYSASSLLLASIDTCKLLASRICPPCRASLAVRIIVIAQMLPPHARHSLEEDASWENYQAGSSHARRLQASVVKDIKIKKDRPPVSQDTEHGLMIDAGSQGTRIHVYEFDARLLKHRHQVKQVVKGQLLSFPLTDSRWTARLKPGLDVFAFIEDDDERNEAVGIYLEPLVDFAQTVLQDKEDYWSVFPIYLKATGGLRSLPRPLRIRLMHSVRHVLMNRTFNPFQYEKEYARVISGEEEAIYGWTAVNFVKGALLSNSEGSGTVLHPETTYGVLEMGGASAQIGFFEPNGDVMANLFKLQIGAAKHWNVVSIVLLTSCVYAAM